MTKVVSISGDPIKTAEPNPEVVEELEQWLEKAKSGEIIGVAVAVNYRDAMTGSRWAGRISRSLVGQCFALANRITQTLDEINK